MLVCARLRHVAGSAWGEAIHEHGASDRTRNTAVWYNGRIAEIRRDLAALRSGLRPSLRAAKSNLTTMLLVYN